MLPVMPLLIEENVPLAPMTTLQIGGAARFFAEAQHEHELREAFAFATERQLPVFVLGGGSNVLIADDGFRGLVVRVALRGITWNDDDDQTTVTANAGESWDNFVRQCVARNLAGIECLSGIPGLVGGTPVQNVGAYGQEVSETIVAVRAYDRQANQVVTLDNTACGFRYRTSIFNTTEKDRYVVLAVTYALKPNGEPTLRYPDVKNYFAGRTERPSLAEVRQAVIEIRARKGMVIQADDPDCRSAGSFFKNPILAAETLAKLEAAAKTKPPSFSAEPGKVKVPAAWLIEHAGFQKGYVKGRAGISSKHTLALINRGNASASDVLALVAEIQQQVNERFGVWLMPEPIFVGFNS